MMILLSAIKSSRVMQMVQFNLVVNSTFGTLIIMASAMQSCVFTAKTTLIALCVELVVLGWMARQEVLIKDLLHNIFHFVYNSAIAIRAQ